MPSSGLKAQEKQPLKLTVSWQSQMMKCWHLKTNVSLQKRKLSETLKDLYQLICLMELKHFVKSLIINKQKTGKLFCRYFWFWQNMFDRCIDLLPINNAKVFYIKLVAINMPPLYLSGGSHMSQKNISICYSQIWKCLFKFLKYLHLPESSAIDAKVIDYLSSWPRLVSFNWSLKILIAVISTVFFV